jgi:ABC-type sugar transport system permease subunit
MLAFALLLNRKQKGSNFYRLALYVPLLALAVPAA